MLMQVVSEIFRLAAIATGSLFAGNPRRNRRSSRMAGLEMLEVRELMTDPIRDINPTVSPYGYGLGSNVSQLTPVGDTLFFVAYSPEHGTELWKTDGTKQGTRLVRDLRPGATSTNPRSLTNVNGRLFFVADDGLSGRSKLWTSDGTEAGTNVVSGILSTSPDLDVKHLSNVNGMLYFSASAFSMRALYRLDVISNRVEMLTRGSGESGFATVPAGPVVEMNGHVFFPATGQALGNELWKVDPAAFEGAVLVKDIWPGPTGSSLSKLTAGNGVLYFSADDGQSGTELWASDGTSEGTKRLVDSNLGAFHGYPADLTVVDDRLFFSAARKTGTSTQERTLWTSEGASASTVEVLPPETLKDPIELRSVNGRLYFQGESGTYYEEPWISDGTANGTRMIRDIDTRGGSSSGSEPTDFVGGLGITYFAASHPDTGREIWQSNGSYNETRLALDVVEGEIGSNPDRLVVWNGKLAFTASSYAFGEELYVVDLLAAPTILSPPLQTVQQRPLVDWTDVTSIAHYEVQIFKSVYDFGTGLRLVTDLTVSESQLVPTADLGIGYFHVHVRAVGASGITSPWSPFRQFTIDTPVQLIPMSKVQLTGRPTVAWQALSGAAAYDVWLNNLTTRQSEFVRAQVRGTSWTPSTDLPLGRYRVWVRGIGAVGVAQWSTLMDFDVQTPATLTSPVLPIFNRRPSFTWTSVPGALSYDVYVKSMNSGGVVHYPRGISATTWTPPVNLADGPYRWWVQAVGTNGFRSAWSTPIDIYVGGRTTVTGPTGNSVAANPIFTWQQVEGTARYELWVANASTLVRVIHQTSLTSAGYSSNNSLGRGTYRVWVRAVSTSGELAIWSAPLDFTVASQRLPQHTEPQDFGELLPVLLPPASDGKLGSPTLSTLAQTRSSRKTNWQSSQTVPEPDTFPAVDDKRVIVRLTDDLVPSGGEIDMLEHEQWSALAVALMGDDVLTI